MAAGGSSMVRCGSGSDTLSRRLDYSRVCDDVGLVIRECVVSDTRSCDEPRKAGWDAVHH